MLNFRDRTRSGVFMVIWPLAIDEVEKVLLKKAFPPFSPIATFEWAKCMGCSQMAVIIQSSLTLLYLQKSLVRVLCYSLQNIVERKILNLKDSENF